MDISNLNTSVLKSVLKLTEKREALLAELSKVEGAIAAIYGGKTVSVKSGRAAAAKPALKKGRGKSSRRGALKESILGALKAAGDKGITVKELSQKLGVKNQNVHVWFSSTGRKLGTIQKVGSGRYRLKA